MAIKWNPKVRMIISDVDETIADIYTPASNEMILGLERVLRSGIVLFLISGGGLTSIEERIVLRIKRDLRTQIIIAHCSGAEIVGYDAGGKQMPLYSSYDKYMTHVQKRKWRVVTGCLMKEFGLKRFPTMPVESFRAKSRSEPLAVMYDDRGPQITLEFPNAYDLTEVQRALIPYRLSAHRGVYDLRYPVREAAQKGFNQAGIPVTARLGGVFALDFALRGVSKTSAVKLVVENSELLAKYGLSVAMLSEPSSLEVWGDKFSVANGGTDRHICEALPRRVRAIDFRRENSDEFLQGYNIVVWDGRKHLHDGLLEYLDQYKG